MNRSFSKGTVMNEDEIKGVARDAALCVREVAA
jgi:hypothetical protein